MDLKKVDLTTSEQKAFAGILLVGILILFYWLLPPLIVIMSNIIIAGFLGIVILFAILMRQTIWAALKQLSWNMTKQLIGTDKLGYMYRYYDPYLLGKINNLSESIKKVASIATQMRRKAEQLKNNIENNSQKYISYKEKGSTETVLNSLMTKVSVDKKQLDNLMPKIISTENQYESLRKLYDLWVADAEDLKYTLDAKAEEYKLLKELDKAAGSANAFLKADSAEFRMYKESLLQIEESVSKYTANMDDFERKAKPIIENLTMDKEINESLGKKIIEEWQANKVNLKIQ